MKYNFLRVGQHLSLAIFACVLASCSQEPPRTVLELMENPRLLEATMVRCAANRTELKYTEECQNAREAVDKMASREEESSRERLEAESVRKRDALRRARQAAEAARTRADEAERLRREAEYLGQFEDLPADRESALPANGANASNEAAAPPAVPSTAPQDAAPQPAEAAPDSGATLEEVREELRRRQSPPQN